MLEALSVSVDGGEVVGLLGANGAGKTTLLRALNGLLRPERGMSLVDGIELGKHSRRTLARHVAYLPQGAECHWHLEVEQVVALGRLPHRRPWAPMSRSDWQAVERAMAYTDVTQFSGRRVSSLSTGERSRVLIARALAGEPRIVLADEPVAGLDPSHQLEIMSLLGRLASSGTAVVVVLHDLTLAARYCTRLLLLHGGGIHAHSPEGPFVIPLRQPPPDAEHAR